MDEYVNSDVVVLIPTLNEEEGLAATVLEVMQFLNKPYILVVDGNSSDGTVDVAKRLGLDVVFQDGKGKGDAIGKALKLLRYADPKYAVFIDADFTYPAEYIPRMIGVLEENPEVGMVCGDRFDKPFGMANVRSAYYLGNRFLAFAHFMVNGVNMRDPLTGLRVVRWEMIKDWQPRSKGCGSGTQLSCGEEGLQD
ncbi:MAG: glycosyltransferase family 2 protein [Candidatus Bathyarchaeia archaeon]|nr:glycosyltransferase family 2 protein [Candidatus Bathyarchaeia archaeon]